MELKANYIASYKILAGSGDWGPNYLFGPDKKGWIYKAWWYGINGSDTMFSQWLLAEIRHGFN